jgi:hypothetical protein
MLLNLQHSQAWAGFLMEAKWRLFPSLANQKYFQKHVPL